MNKQKLFSSLFFALALLIAQPALAEQTFMPFVLAQTSTGDAASVITQAKQKILAAGFMIAGEYSPYADTDVIVITNDRLKSHAAKTEFGGFGAALRVTVTKSGNEIQLAYTNPVYMSNVYRMDGDLADVAEAMKKALGYVKEYGPENGLTAAQLREYHYKFMMPYFDDHNQLAMQSTYEKATAAVEKGLAEGKGGTKKVYRIDIPGKQETVFGVGLAGPETNECSGDHYIMSRIDFKPMKSSGHLPYELLVSGSKIYALYAEFRIAINFPDLSMMGSNSFASIMCAPSSIEEALKKVANTKP